jgi:uncharacterized membrane protein
MTWLLLGLLVFLGMHSLRMIAPTRRDALVARLGGNGWRALFASVSVLGFVFIVIGFGQMRLAPTPLYAPAAALKHLNALFTLVAFVLVAAAYVPRNRLKARLRHPMLAGTLLWALGHLLSTGMLHDTILFGAFALWAGTDFLASRRRDRRAAAPMPSGTAAGDVLVAVVGVIAWAFFAFWGHAVLLGVDVTPF